MSILLRVGMSVLHEDLTTSELKEYELSISLNLRGAGVGIGTENGGGGVEGGDGGSLT